MSAMQDTALLLCDLQNDFLHPQGAYGRAGQTAPEIAALPARLAPLQAAFHEQYGSQCGFCTPGMLMATHALLERTPSPSRGDIEEALAGHICRCTGYVKIIASIEAAASGDVASDKRTPSLEDADPNEPDMLIPGSPA